VSEGDEGTAAGESGTVSVLTVHASKGLEFKAVFIVGLEEGTFPHVRSLNSTSKVDEERRLAYVGFTRAKDLLYLTYRQKLRTEDQTTPSRFLSLPSSVTMRILHNGVPYSDILPNCSLIVLTRAALSSKAKDFLEHHNIRVVNWLELEQRGRHSQA